MASIVSIEILRIIRGNMAQLVLIHLGKTRIQEKSDIVLDVFEYVHFHRDLLHDVRSLDGASGVRAVELRWIRVHGNRWI